MISNSAIRGAIAIEIRIARDSNHHALRCRRLEGNTAFARHLFEIARTQLRSAARLARLLGREPYIKAVHRTRLFKAA